MSKVKIDSIRSKTDEIKFRIETSQKQTYIAELKICDDKLSIIKIGKRYPNGLFEDVLLGQGEEAKELILAIAEELKKL